MSTGPSRANLDDNQGSEGFDQAMYESEQLLRLEPETIKKYVEQSTFYLNDLKAVECDALRGDPMYDQLMDRVRSFQY